MQTLDLETLKACYRVCRKWCLAATEFLFCAVVRHQGNLERFNAILAQANLSVFIKVISIGRVDNTGRDLLHWIRSDRVLQRLTGRPTIADVRQVGPNQFAAELTRMDSRNSSVLPALQKIRLIANEPPYVPLHLFNGLRCLYVQTLKLQLPDSPTWESLADVVLRGTVDLDKFFDSLGGLLQSHRCIGKLHLAVVSPLRNLDASPSIIPATIKRILGTELHPELVEQIMTRAQMSAEGHEQLFVRNIHAELDKLTDTKTAEILRGDIYNLFKLRLKYELEKYALILESMGVPPENRSKLELSCSIEFFWQDELVIRGGTLPEDYTSRFGLWRDIEFRG